MTVQVAVCGPAECTTRDAEYAHRVGRLLAERGAIVLCGGGTGVMAAAARGARSAGGIVIAIVPGDRGSATADVTAVIATDMGQARNAVIVSSADAVIAVGGSWGTLSEVAHAVRRGGVPVISVNGWRVFDPQGDPVPGVVQVDTPDEAVERALAG